MNERDKCCICDQPIGLHMWIIIKINNEAKNMCLSCLETIKHNLKNEGVWSIR